MSEVDFEHKIYGTKWVPVQIYHNFAGKNTLVMYGRDYSQLFKTRQQCRVWIEKNWGFLRDRPDLQREPHKWTMPKPRKVQVVLRILK